MTLAARGVVPVRGYTRAMLECGSFSLEKSEKSLNEHSQQKASKRQIGGPLLAAWAKGPSTSHKTHSGLSGVLLQ